MDVHNRDITEWLSKTSISTVSEFDWQAQLRYYWDNDGVSSQTGKPETIPCRMINAMILYAYEYMGNCGRLVITPLTDCLLYTSPSPRDISGSRMPSSA